MSKIFIDGAGRYYQGEKAKDRGDCEFNHPSAEMFQFLTEVPITRIMFEYIVSKKDVLINNPIDVIFAPSTE